MDALPIRKSLQKEQSFFQSHPKYRVLPTKCGTSQLSRSLNQILMAHIRECLPDIKLKIHSMLNDVQVRTMALHCMYDVVMLCCIR